ASFAARASPPPDRIRAAQARNRRIRGRPRPPLPPDPATARRRGAAACPHLPGRRADRVSKSGAPPSVDVDLRRRHRRGGAGLVARTTLRAQARAASFGTFPGHPPRLRRRLEKPMTLRVVAGLVALWPALAFAQRAEEGAERPAPAPEAPSLLAGAVDPDKYVVGPGDKLLIALWGLQEQSRETEVNAEGRLVLPRIGVFPSA